MSNVPPIQSPTAGGAAARAEEVWFNDAADAMEEYLKALRAWLDAPKSEREALGLKAHELKMEFIDRFYRGYLS